MNELAGAVAKLPMLTKQEACTFLEQPKPDDEGNGCTEVAQLSGRLRHSGALTGTQQSLESGRST